MNHTQGKFETDGSESEPIITCRDTSIAMCFDITGDEQIANARELVRRWNAFEEDGITTKMLEAVVDINNLENQRKAAGIGYDAQIHDIIKDVVAVVLAENERNPE